MTMDFMPQLMISNDGRPVTDAAAMALRRKELLEILQTHAYGAPIPPVRVSGRVVGTDRHCACGNAAAEDVRVTCKMSETADFTFPLRLYLPKAEKPLPLILLLNFSPDKYHEYIQPEEIMQNGFALAVLYYEHLTRDNGDFTDQLAAFFPRTGSGADAGKITVWAWGASRALDYLLGREEIDAENAALIGHSRLGKTALWCAAQDERIRFVCSNDSGCMGAAYHRTLHEGGESLAAICRQFPFWFCENLLRRNGDITELPFDQHFLIAAAAPRFVCVNSAALDDWADPASEQLSCLAASPAWNACGKRGFIGTQTPCAPEGGFPDGDIAYYKRSGSHFLGRTDWLHFMEFVKPKLKQGDRL